MLASDKINFFAPLSVTYESNCIYKFKNHGFQNGKNTILMKIKLGFRNASARNEIDLLNWFVKKNQK